MLRMTNTHYIHTHFCHMEVLSGDKYLIPGWVEWILDGLVYSSSSC